jgi:hypothetical protein
MTDITTTDWSDYCAGRMEYRERPAEPGDVRFEIGPQDEDGYCTVLWIDDKGVIVEQDYTREPHAIVEGFRMMQERNAEAERLGVHPLEIEYAPFGPAWQREQRERGW